MSRKETDKMPVKDKIALITGGSRGIGRAVGLRLTDSGFTKIIIGYLQNEKEAKKTCKMIQTKGGEGNLASGNLANLDDVDQMFIKIQESIDHIDSIIHCAALNTFKPLTRIKPNQWDLTLNINTRGFLYIVQKCLPLMRSGGTVIAVSSIGSQRFIPNYGAMGPAKAALESVIKYLAVELAPLNIRVNGVSGGLIQTDSLQKFPDYQKMIEEIQNLSPVKRIGKPEEIAAIVSFLASDEARFIYGQTIIADGGISLF